MTGIAVTGGMAPPKEEIENYLKEADCIVAADSGLDTLLAYGFEPDYIVGDMDSLSERHILDRFASHQVKVFPEDKDYTDTELALMKLAEMGCKEICLIGGGGGRLDHLLAIYSLFHRKSAPDQWITHKEKIFLVKENFCINLKTDTLVSLFPVGEWPCLMESEGLKWSLNTLKWGVGDLGISNVAVDETVRINMKSGRLIMIVPLGESSDYGR